MSLQKVLSQRLNMTQTLKSTIHKARISQITQTHQSMLSPWLWLVVHNRGVKFLRGCIAVLQVVVFVLWSAILIAVLNFLAGAEHLHGTVTVATFALAVHAGVSVELEDEMAIFGLLFYYY